MNRIGRFFTVLMITLLGMVIGNKSARADLVMRVVPTRAPHPYLSSSYPQWTQNVFQSLIAGGGSIGDRNVDPAAYTPAGSRVHPRDVVMTSDFNSWEGQLNPGGLFADERGNYLKFNVIITGGGNTPQFRASNLFFELSGGDPANRFSYSSWLGGAGFNFDCVGIDFGPDRQYGGGDDLIFDSGAETRRVDMFMWTGAGNALDTIYEPGSSPQDRLNSALSYLGQSEFPFGVAYTQYADGRIIELVSGSSSVTIPGPGALMGLALALVQVRRKR